MDAPAAPSRVEATAAARAVNAAFFLAVSAYCLLLRSSFAYEQLIKPGVVSALTGWVAISPWLYWVVLLITVLTLMRQLRGGHGHRAARAYVVVNAAAGAAFLIRPPLPALGNSTSAEIAGLVALVPPIWLALVDRMAWSWPRVTATDPWRVLVTSVATAVAACGAYALASPVRLRDAVNIVLPPRAYAVAIASSLALDVFVFMGICAALLVAIGLASRVRERFLVEFWLFVLLLGVGATFVLGLLVCTSIGFTGRDAWISSAAFGAAFAMVWADLARIRSARRPPSAPIDSLALFSASVASTEARDGGLWRLALLPFAAYALPVAVAQIDWNFLLQKLGVLLVWLVAFSTIHAAFASRRRPTRRALVFVPGLAILFVQGLKAFEAQPRLASHLTGDARLNAAIISDRYAVIDPSFRLIRDGLTTRTTETTEYYRYLRANTLLTPSQVSPPSIDFVRPLRATADRKPNIFLIVVDSLRRDYLSPYNAQVSFTPHIGELAADSFVFSRAFTRYAGTALSVPSIWAGGMVPHMAFQSVFEPRNTLNRLLDAEGYRRVMDLDNIVQQLLPRDVKVEQLDRGTPVMDVDVCSTFDELETKLDRGEAPVFFYSLPQNVHITVASQRKVPAGESYPGFFPRVASSVYRLDRCVGQFVAFLEATNRYDDSIVILTADHGDSLGEEGRWGHAHYIVPEVMRVPLIVHLPSWMRSRVTANLDAASFLTDITPTLYSLLGHEPAALGPLFGRPLFVGRGADESWRRREIFLLGSSYGAVYAVLRNNATEMYVVDAVDGRDDLFNMDAGDAERLALTHAMTMEGRGLIRERLDALAAKYGVRPR